MDSNTPFPQANDLSKLLKLILNYNNKTKKDLKNLLNINSERQLNYYFNAGVFLGFFEFSDKDKFKLSKTGLKVVREQLDFKKERFILCVLNHELIKQVVFNYNEYSIKSNLDKFIKFEELSNSTKARRVSTIKSWIKWLNKNI